MTKIERKNLIRELIAKQQLDVLFSEEDLAELNRLTGWTAVAAKRIFNKRFPNDTKCIAILNYGADFEAWSWVKAVDGYNFSKNVTHALREAIKDQLFDYAVLAESVCIRCGATKNLSVDHKTKSFTKIASEFRILFPRLNYEISNKHDGGGWVLNNSSVEAAWQEYHQKHADYQILCRSCNSAKGARHDA
jgi:5-methylcytosine-specific restriction endonuclease McrA